MYTDAMIDITVISRYSGLQNAIQELERITESCILDCVQRTDHLTAIVTKIASHKVDQLANLSDHVDLLLVRAVQSAVLSEAYKRTLLVDEHALYSSTAVSHSGKMSSISSATYPWMIERDGPNELGSIVLLVQQIQARGVTSCHYHETTKEFFLSLLGRTMMACKGLLEQNERVEHLAKHVFGRVLPKTVHQLKAAEYSLNVLCMEPYDRRLEDHRYSPDLFAYLPANESSGKIDVPAGA